MYVDNPFKSPVILSFCTGGSMLEEGLERAIGNYTVATYVEIEAFCIFNLVSKMETGMVVPAPVFTDIKTFEPKHFRGKINGIIGGYPCQPFSLAGHLKGENDERHLWPYFRKNISVIRPGWCLFENVANHLNIGYETVRNDLQELGYQVAEGIFSAEEVGAPHVRKRLFILALENTYHSGMRRWFQATDYGFCCKTSGPGIMEYPCCCTIEQCSGCTCIQTKFHSLRHSGNVPNPDCSGVGKMEFQCKNTVGQKSYSNGYERRVDRWPASRGKEQYEWEAPRVIKSGMGCTVNGYNFREDLLRMYGNGVVPATADKAIKHLLMKLFIKHQ